MSTKPCTIILPTYCPDAQVEEYLRKCWVNLAANTSLDLFELVIVEQGNPILGKSILRNFQGEPFENRIKYLWTGKPVGYARAVNIGVALAKTEFICILNNDLFVPSGWLETMLAEFAAISNCGVLAPFDGPIARLDPSGVVRPNEGWWSCVLMRRKDFLELGGLDDQALNYRFHDQDFNIKMHSAGMMVARTGKVIVEHIDSATYSRMPERANADVAEKAEMVRRWGSDSYYGWLASGSADKR